MISVPWWLPLIAMCALAALWLRDALTVSVVEAVLLGIATGALLIVALRALASIRGRQPN